MVGIILIIDYWFHFYDMLLVFLLKWTAYRVFKVLWNEKNMYISVKNYSTLWWVWWSCSIKPSLSAICEAIKIVILINVILGYIKYSYLWGTGLAMGIYLKISKNGSFERSYTLVSKMLLNDLLIWGFLPWFSVFRKFH